MVINSFLLEEIQVQKEDKNSFDRAATSESVSSPL